MRRNARIKLLTALAAALMLVAALALCACSGGDGGSGGASGPQMTVHVTIDGTEGGKGIIYDGDVTIAEGESAYTATLATEVDMVSGSSLGMGAYVSSIAGLSEKDPQPTSGWIYSVNGEHASVSCDGYTLADGDVVEWVWHIDAVSAQ